MLGIRDINEGFGCRKMFHNPIVFYLAPQIFNFSLIIAHHGKIRKDH